MRDIREILTDEQFNSLKWKDLDADDLPDLLEDSTILSAEKVTDGERPTGFDLYLSKGGKEFAVYIGADPIEDDLLLIEYAELDAKIFSGDNSTS